ncbi:MAG: site-2 protease family protein [Vulcanimicrobiota bacterium]
MDKALGWSFHLFTFRGIPVRAHWTLLIVEAYYLFSEPAHFELSAIFAGALFLSVLLHEFGHAFMTRALGGHADRILLWPLGGLAYVRHRGDLRDQIKISAAGPAVHIPITLACIGGAVALGAPFDWQYFSPFWTGMPSEFWPWALIGIAKIQIQLFLFNVFVPAYPMDGGKILVCTLLLLGFHRDKTARFTIGFSCLAGLVMMVLGGTLLIGLLLFYEAYRLHQLQQSGALDAHPLFHGQSSRIVPPKPRKKRRATHLRVVEGRTCPDCKRSVPPQAQMCGFCEKMLPKP